MMRPLCEAFGPDAILFPRLRGIGQVDLWLRDQIGLPESLFADCEWKKSVTDANPLFSAALPNRFVAVVPASKAKESAEQCEKAVREWLQKTGIEVVSLLLKEAGFDTETPTPFEQMKAQLQGFSEVHWAVVPFSLIAPRDKEKQTDLDLTALKAAQSPFFGVAPEENAGFLASPAWKVLQKEIDWGDGTTFFAPNPGVLYPAIFELAERALAASKSTRHFAQIAQNAQEGWRCSLTGEAEWLTTDRAQLQKSYRQQPETLWAKIAAKKPSWAKKGEHLSALPAIKRLWPTIFAEEVGKALNAEDDGTAIAIGRFVVSTHTMALAHQLDQWLRTNPDELPEIPAAESVAMPRKLLMEHGRKAGIAIAKKLPGLLDAARDTDDENKLKEAQSLVRQTLGEQLETYYALIMLDGDHMGAILSGDEKTAISYLESFHPNVRGVEGQNGFKEAAAHQPLIQQYGAQKRPVSPNRHLAISGALNDFSQTVVRHVVENDHLGRVLYAGGDDVLAMLPVTDLLSAMQKLRMSYRGTDTKEIDWRQAARQRGTLFCKNGFAILDGKLMRMMGEKATASCGAVIAHHQAPLSAVLRELRKAEKRAKEEGGRDAFSITVIKRSGGALYLTAKWGEPLAVLEALIVFLRDDDVSRRAVYHTLEWLKDLPEPAESPALLENMLAYQLNRQAGGEGQTLDAAGLAKRLVALAQQESKSWLENFLTVGEFLARETRQSKGDRP